MKKNNTLLIIIVLVLAIIVVSIGIGLSAFNKTKTDSNGQQSITNNKDTVDVKVDLEKASNELTNYFALYLKTNTTDSNLNKNLMESADNRLEIIDDYFMSNGGGVSFNDNQSMYINIDTYKNKYKEIYGSLDSFDSDTKTVSPARYSLASSIDSSLAANLVAWNSLRSGVMYDKVEMKASNASYDKSSKSYKLTGTVNYSQSVNTVESSSVSLTKSFTITYVSTGDTNYMTSLILS
ncbi:MAG: Tar ligand binding domain-containing protein [bacterium]|nr:Tar ligand binding domain-containing protein [bacterium]